MIKNMTPRLAEIGRIKIGEKGEERESKTPGKKWRMPKKLDYIQVVHSQRDSNDNFMQDAEIHKLIGLKPTEIDVIFLSDDPNKVFLTSYALYAGRKCTCRGDGDTAVKVIEDPKNPQNVRTETVTCPCPYLKGQEVEGKTYQCKPTGILCCVLAKAQRVGGIWTLRTHSWYTVQNIMSSLMEMLSITGGVLAGIQFKLVLRAKTVQDKGGSSRLIYTLNVEYAGGFMELQNVAMGIAKTRGNTQRNTVAYMETIRGLLTESAEEAAAVNEEFSPETADAPTPFKVVEAPAVPTPQAPNEPVKTDEKQGGLF